MCYSAMVEEDHRSYLRLLQGYIDFEQFYEMYVRRAVDAAIMRAAWPVSKRANTPKNNDASLFAPAAS